MAPLSTFLRPLPSNRSPGYSWEEYNASVISTTTAFNTVVDQRDTFLGRPRCLICGLDDCHIIGDSDPQISNSEQWSNLKARCWIPSQAHPRHEPRSGLLMCAHHHLSFDAYAFFMRFLPDQAFVLVNYSNKPSLRQYHGKTIALDVKDRHDATFASLFILQDTRVHLIFSDGAFDNVSGSFNYVSPPGNEDNGNVISTQSLSQFQPTTMSIADASSGPRRLALNAEVAADILAATCEILSWKVCQIEGTSWTGMAEENVKKYVSSINKPEL
ncbi:hypothetical protein BDN70DRAFT_952691 [Pholiota conissans]|uniref:HNH nuclease domain-containing protein n=1 Tax=Pholiota conissans TaxID=109636 RepID=A0A9P5YV81_9AGAR|nr:hypothetical protein BDN70DRAFT_952691 [Pholiota conissans]